MPFESSVYTTTKQLEYFGKSFCIGWSELPEGKEFPAGQVPSPLHILKPYGWEAEVLPTGEVLNGATEYQLVFTASFLTDSQDVTYSRVVTHAETFTVRHTAKERDADSHDSVQSSRPSPGSMQEYQAQLSEVIAELRAVEVVAPSLREGLEELIGAAAQIPREMFESERVNKNSIEGNPYYLLRMLTDAAEELRRSDSPLKSERGLEVFEEEIIAQAKADVHVAGKLLRERFLQLPIDVDHSGSEATPGRGTPEARQLIGLCEKWGIPLSTEQVATLVGESDPAKVRGKVFDHLWPSISQQTPAIEQRPGPRAVFLLEAALSRRVEATPITPESRVGWILNHGGVLTGTSQRQIDWFFYLNLKGLPSMLALDQVRPYRNYAIGHSHSGEEVGTGGA